MPGIGVVINPQAGGNRGVTDRALRLGDLLGPHGWVRETRTIEALPEVAAECRQKAVDVLAVCGGDGTFGQTLSALVRVYGERPLPSFLPLRAGTMNTVARSIGCRAWEPERMLAEVAADYRSGRPLDNFEHQLLSVNGESYCFMLGAGVVVGFLRAYYGNGRRGPFGGAQVLARLIVSAVTGGAAARRAFEWLSARMECDGVSVPFDRFSVVYVSSIEEIGLGFRPTYRARERRDRFHVFAGPVDAVELVRCLPRIKRGVATGSPQIFDATAGRVVVEFARPSSYMMDGDIMPAVGGLVIEPGPVLRVIGKGAS
jgi:diacylglycerol kinase family enzyme